MKTGELCAGYNGLGMAVEEVFGATPAWFSEYDAAPSKILAHHYPDVPNYGDMTQIDWANIEPADIISGGTPCQDLSAAGKRKGMTEGTRSNLWVNMREGIAIQRPKYVVWENVRGAYSATAASDLEQCPGCMGDTADGGAVLRALGRVLGDLSDLGFNAEWRGLRAADVGACHSRYRVFVLAYDPSRVGRGEALQHYGSSATANNWAGVLNQPDRHSLRVGSIGEAVTDRDHIGVNGGGERAEQDRRGQPADGRFAVANTDRGHDDGRFGNPQRITERGEASAWGRQGSRTLAHTECRGRREGCEQSRPGTQFADHNGGLGKGSFRTEDGNQKSIEWGAYRTAIARWESVMGRRAPSPTEPTGRDAGHRLSPRFTEWMMGLPDGWVTDPAIGISRNEQLKACGNGVVPQQAVAALKDMLAAIQQKELAA